MQLILNVSEADFGTELRSIMDSLTLEEKKAIAREVLVNALNEVTDTQRTLREKEEHVMNRVRKSLYGSEKMTDEQVRNHYEYKQIMSTTKSAKELAIEEIIKSAISTFKESAKDLIAKDENLKKVWAATEAQIREDFPKYIHDAMIYYFASQLSEMQSGIQTAIMQAEGAKMGLENIQQRLSQ